MSVNPWLVENIQAFSSLNCPECVFKTRTEVMFKNHAISNHPLSCVLFKKSTKTIGKEENMSGSESEQLAEEGHKTLEELMYSEFGAPEPLNHIQVTIDNQNYNSYGAKKVDTTDYLKEELLEEIIYPENNGISVKCRDNDMKIKKKPKSVTESLPESLLANYRATISSVNSTDSLIKKSLKCPYTNCDFKTLRKSSLDVHIKSHINCQFCGEMFPGKIKLAVHLTKCRPKPEKQYLCDFCSKDCKYRQSKWRHMKICKTTPINFVCEFCNNDFSYLCRKDLNEHRQMCSTDFNESGDNEIKLLMKADPLLITQ